MTRLIYFATLLSTCFAHSRWVYPPKRSGENNMNGGVKLGPCGGYTPSATKTVLTPGWQTLEFEETIRHTGAPWRIALGRSGGAESGFEECTLLNHIPHNDQAVTPQSYKIRVFIPDVQCDHCVIQLANPMTDKLRGRPGAPYCDLTLAKLEQCAYGTSRTAACEDGVCFSNYFSCADVQITGSQPRDAFTCSQPSEWPFQEGSGIPLPCNNQQDCRPTTRDSYTQISVQWSNGWIADNSVPAIFRSEVSPELTTPLPELTTPLPELTSTSSPETTQNDLTSLLQGDASTTDDGAIAAAVVVPLVIIGLLIAAVCYYYQDSISEFMNKDGGSNASVQKYTTNQAPASSTVVQIQDTATEWYYVHADESVGPVSQKVFEERLGRIITYDTLIWNPSMSEWKTAQEVPSVKRALDANKLTSSVGSRPPAPPLPPQGPKRTVTKPRGDPATANVEWQYVNGAAEGVTILEKDLIALNLPGETYVWNGTTVQDWTYIQDTYLWQWSQMQF